MTNLKAFTFQGKKSASKAFEAIEDKLYDYDWYIEGNVAEISVNKNGVYRVHSTWAQDDDNVSGGIGLGAVLGGLIGCLFGPGGAIAGAAWGGSLGGLIGEADNIDLEDPQLEAFAESLLPDTSALIIIGTQSEVDAFTEALASYEYKTFETAVDKATIDALKTKMKNRK